METRKLDEIVWRADLYPRLKPDPGKVQSYADDLAVLPPIEVNQDNVLIDGYHRWRAHQLANAESLRVTVTPTASEAEVLMLAVARNATHGLQLSAEDKRHYALCWWDELPDAQICATLSIAPSTLNRWTQHRRRQKEAEAQAAIIARWLRCESQATIAAATGVDDAKVSRVIADFSQKAPLSDLSIFHDFRPKLYNVWKFAPPPAGERPGGPLPPELLDNLLYYYTQPLDVVFDPFAGGGMTIDVCQQRQRRYYVSDLTPSPARLPEMRQWDITQGLPDDLPVPDFVFLDPPYWRQAAGQASNHPNDLAQVSLAGFLKTLGDLAKAVKRKWGAGRPQARLALLMGLWKENGTLVDLPFLCYQTLAKYLQLEARIQVPYPPEIYDAPTVQAACADKQCLSLMRELLVFRRAVGEGEE